MKKYHLLKTTVSLRRNQKGFALILTMVMLAILSILGVMVLNTTNTELGITSNYRMTSDAFVQAEQALEIAKEKILQDRDKAELFPSVADDYSPLLSSLYADGINEINSYVGTMPPKLAASFSVDMTSKGNIFRTTEDGSSSGSIMPFYRTTVETELRGRSVSRIETVIVDLTGGL